MPIDPKQFESIRNDFTGKRFDGPTKYTGSKNHRRYNGPLRRMFSQTPSKKTGGLRRTLEPFMGGLNVSSNINPGGRALVADYNRFVGDYFNRIKDNDMVVDNEPFLNEDGVIDNKTYYEQIRGGTPRGRKQEKFDTSWKNLQPDSLNDFIRREKLAGGLTPDEHRKMIEKWAQFQRLAWRGDPRMNSQGYANQTSNAPEFKEPKQRDLGEFAPVYENYDIRGGMSFEDFFKLPMDPDDDFGVIDSPYAGGEGANYDHNMSEEQQKLLAELVGEQAAEGMPIVAFNHPSVTPMYEKHGFKTEINRPDRYNNYNQGKNVKPEAVMHNIDDFEWFPEKSKDPFETSWDLLVKDAKDLDFSFLTPAKERNMFWGDMLEEIPRTEEEELSEVQMDEKDDPCCEEAYSKYNQLLRECYSGAKPKPLENWNFSWEQGNACDSFRGALERNSSTKPERWSEQGWIKYQEGKAKILAEWDACASNADWHDIAASADPFETSWDLLVKDEYGANVGEISDLKRRSDESFEQHREQAVGMMPQTDEGVDECCKNAFDEVGALVVGTNWDDFANFVEDNYGGEQPCSVLREMMEGEVVRKLKEVELHYDAKDTYSASELKEEIRVIKNALNKWDACASNSNPDWHNITASADPFKTAWDSITKKGKFKGYSRSNISDRPYRQGKAKAWGIGRKVKRERTQKRYKRNQARGNFRPAMRRQLGAGGTRASSNR
jgi:hypothetical protein